MQSFGDFFANNKLLALGILLAAIAAILAIGFGLFRLVFGRRLHMSGGRTRQPRLGIVDAFDLDRQRQLVLVRRDNVEHLLMIGGPNDLLIEAAIVRTAATLAAPTFNHRERENGASGPSVAIPVPVPQQGVGPVVQISGPDGTPVAAALPSALLESGPVLPGIAVPPGRPAVEPPPSSEEPVKNEPPAPSVATDPSRAAPSASPAAGARGFPPASPFQRPAPNAQTRPPFPAIPRPAATTTPSAPPVARPPLSRATPLPPGVARPTAAPQSSRVDMGFEAPRSVQETGGPTHERNGTVDQKPAIAVDNTAVRRTPSVPSEESPTGVASIVPADMVSSAQPRPEHTGELPPHPAKIPNGAPRPITPPPLRPQQPAKPSAPQPNRNLGTLGSLEEEMAKLLGRPLPPSDKSEG